MKTHRVCFLVTHHSDDMKCNFSPRYYSKASNNHQIGKNDHKVIKVRRKMLRMLKKVVVCWDILCRYAAVTSAANRSIGSTTGCTKVIRDGRFG